MEDKLIIDILHYPFPTVVVGPGLPNMTPMRAHIKFTEALMNCTRARIVGYSISSAYGDEQGSLNIPPRDPYVMVDVMVNTRSQTTIAGYNPLYYSGLGVGPTATNPLAVGQNPILPATGEYSDRVSGFPILMPAMDSMSVPNLDPPIDITNLCRRTANEQRFDITSINISVNRPPYQLRNINKSGASNTIGNEAVLMDRLVLYLSVTRESDARGGMPRMADGKLPDPRLLVDTDGKTFTDMMRDASFHKFGQSPWL